MFTIIVESCFWGSHQVSLPDGSKEPLHSHNWKVQVKVSSQKLSKMGLVMDFRCVKGLLEEILAGLENNQMEKTEYFKQNNSSAENVAKYIYHQLQGRLEGNGRLDSVCVTEEPGCSAEYRQ